MSRSSGSPSTAAPWAGCCAPLLLLLAAGCASDVRLPRAATGPRWPPPPEPARIEFVGSFADPADLGIRRGWLRVVVDLVAGASSDELVHPYAIAVYGEAASTGPDGSAGPARIAVADTGSASIHLYDLENASYERITSAGPLGALEAPVGVGFDHTGRLYACDSGLAAVLRYTPDGAFDQVLDVTFPRPAGLAVDAASEALYVADAADHVVHELELDGTRVRTLDLGLRYPTHLSTGGDGRLLVSDSLNFRALVVAPGGAVEAEVGKLGDSSGDLHRPKGVALDSEAHLYVVDALFDNVQVFGLDGSLLLAFGSTGDRPGEFSLPAGLAVDFHDRIYVADTYNGRIQVFRYQGGTRP